MGRHGEASSECAAVVVKEQYKIEPSVEYYTTEGFV